MILLWGLPGDTPMAQVQAALSRRGAATFFLDERAVLDTAFRVGDVVDTGLLTVSGMRAELAEITAVYQRPYGLERVPSLAGRAPHDDAWRHAEHITSSLTEWLEVTSARVVNPSSAMASNGSKPYQAQFIREAGFLTPATLVTTDADAVLAFQHDHGTLIYKSVSGVRSIVSKLTPDKEPRLALLRWGPSQFQEYVGGEDYRVHVVGDEVYACRIRSAADDYRYAGRQGRTTEIEPYTLTEDIAQRCRILAQTLDLAVAGVDLRLHPSRGWYCFEVNPSPAFTYFADAAEQPIADAVAALLAA